MAKKKFKSGLINITIDNPITRSLKKFPKAVQKEIERVVDETSDLLFQRISDATPRDRGDASQGWNKDTTSGAAKAEAVITNKVPYINVLEFGGYPVIPRSRNRPNGGSGLTRGNAVLGGYPPGPRTQVAPGGSPTMLSNVSRQAPSGMARDQLVKIRPRFVFDLEEAIDEAFDKLGGA